MHLKYCVKYSSPTEKTCKPMEGGLCNTPRYILNTKQMFCVSDINSVVIKKKVNEDNINVGTYFLVL